MSEGEELTWVTGIYPFIIYIRVSLYRQNRYRILVPPDYLDEINWVQAVSEKVELRRKDQTPLRPVACWNVLWYIINRPNSALELRIVTYTVGIRDHSRVSWNSKHVYSLWGRELSKVYIHLFLYDSQLGIQSPCIRGCLAMLSLIDFVLPVHKSIV